MSRSQYWTYISYEMQNTLRNETDNIKKGTIRKPQLPSWTQSIYPRTDNRPCVYPRLHSAQRQSACSRHHWPRLLGRRLSFHDREEHRCKQRGLHLFRKGSKPPRKRKRKHFLPFHKHNSQHLALRR